MKTVFSNAMCAHVWAQQNQPHGRANSMHFDGPVMFSYATPVAMFHETRMGRTVLITSQSYSRSTSSKCMPAVRRAIGDTTTFVVPWVGYSESRGWDDSEASHAANKRWLIEQYRNLAKCWSRKRHLTVECMDELERASVAARDYATWFGLVVPWLDPAATYERIQKERAERDTPEAKAKRAKAAVRAEAKKKREAAAELVARKGRQYDWRHGRPVHFHPADRKDEWGGALLRLTNYSNVAPVVQTSLGAVAPLNHVRIALKVWERIVVRGDRGYHGDGNGDRLKLGQFTLDRIDNDGTVYAGCHVFSRGEIEGLAAAIALRDAEVSA